MHARPLPAGIALLLRIAAGSRSSVAAASIALGETEPRVIEAARFYLQQALFHPVADAFRLLAAAPESDTATLREHHRLLQAWLHPDRAGEQWGATYAARVNAAWDRLRDDARREADARRVLDAPLPAMAMRGMRPVGWLAFAEGESRSRWPAIALVLAVVACLGLWWLNQRSRQAGAPGIVVDEPAARGTREAEHGAILALSRTVREVAALSREAETNPQGSVLTPRDPPARAGVQTLSLQPSPRTEQPPEPARIEQSLASGERTVPAASSAPASMVATRSAMVAPQAPSPPDAAVARFDKAIGFLSAREGVPPPIWNDLAGLEAAQAIRGRLRACCAAGALVVMPPTWTIDGGIAHAIAPYRLSRANGRVQTGSLQVDLHARMGNWWISGVRIEPLP